MKVRDMVIHEEDASQINQLLSRFLGDSGAAEVLLIDRSGQLLAVDGVSRALDTVSISALAAAAFSSTSAMAQLLGESEFEELLRGYSIGEILFYDAPIGEAVGPILGPYGYYVGRVIARSPGNRTIDFSSEYGRNLVREDYLSRRFLEWSNEVVSRSTIEVR